MNDQVHTLDIVEALAERGLDFAMAMELPRQYVNSAQIFVAPDMTILVFREQNGMLDANGEPELLAKNVASLIMPTATLREVHKLLSDQLAALDAANPLP